MKFEACLMRIGLHQHNVRTAGDSASNFRKATVFGSYARIDAWREETISMVFFARAKALCLDEFREPVRKIGHM